MRRKLSRRQVLPVAVAAIVVGLAVVTTRAQQAPAAPQPGATQAPAGAYQRQMAADQTAHPTLKVGSAMPDFNLKGTDGQMHTAAEYQQHPILAVAFISNHCPASQLYEGRLKQLQQDYESKGLKLIAIAPNGPLAVSPRELNYTDLDDSFESMIKHAEHQQFNFPYLYDGETQEVAHQFGPKVTPHLFIFDKERKLRYEGRIDDNMRGNNIKSQDARNAMDALVAGQPVPVDHTAVFGCSTKWNSSIEAKKQEMTEWRKQPVNVELIGEQGLADLRKNPTGKYLMINFWATWCGPCVVEYPMLLETYLWYRSRNFDFVSVSTNAPEGKEEVLKFLKEQGSGIKNYIFDSEDVYALQAAFDKTWESGVPFTLVLAPDGSVVFRHEGEVDILQLRRTILANLPDAGAFAGNREYWANSPR